MCVVCNQIGLTAFASRFAVQAIETPDDASNNAPIDPNTPSPGSPGLGDSFYPNFGNGGYDALKYTLDLNVTDVSTSTLDATTTIEAVSTQALSSFNLDFIGFEIEGITVNGQAATFSRDGQELTITPTTAIANGAAFTVAVEYSRKPCRPDGFRLEPEILS